MITIYHNPKCTKSREGLVEIESLEKPFTVRKYIEEPFTKEELTEVLQKLGFKPLELVRTKEKIWIEHYKGKELSDEMADVLWVLICLANQTGVNLTEALEKNFTKKNLRDQDRHRNNEKLL